MILAFEETIFYLLLFSIPFQRRVILWQQNWYFNEWQSFSAYYTDAILIALFLLWLIRHARVSRIPSFKLMITQIKSSDICLVLFLVISAISLKNAQSRTLGFLEWTKLVEFILFYFYVKYYALGRFNIFSSFLSIFVGGLFQSVIAIAQFLHQSDAGLRILGEEVLGLDLAGVAVFINNTGQKIMRAYGTTPHPNILAAYLFISIFSFIAWYFYDKRIISKKIEILALALWGVVLFAFYSTFARTAIFIFFVGLIARFSVVFLKKKSLLDNILKIKFRNLGIVIVISVVLFGLFFRSDVLSRLSLSSHDEAVSLRMYYNKEALKTGINWFGVGAGNFVDWFMVHEPYQPKWFYQPVHNIYLLIYSETGLLGIAIFMMFIIFTMKEFVMKSAIHYLPEVSIFIIFLSLLFIGSFDHFLWTLQQGRFMLWLVLALLSEGYINQTRLINRHAK